MGSKTYEALAKELLGEAVNEEGVQEWKKEVSEEV